MAAKKGEQVKKIWTATVGILLVSEFRNYLKKLKLAEYDIDWIEGSGWIDRDFTIKCDADTYQLIKDRFNQ